MDMKSDKDANEEINIELIDEPEKSGEFEKSSDFEKPSKNANIRINKKVRYWNKYKYFVGGAVVIIIFFIFILKGCNKNNSDNSNTQVTFHISDSTTQSSDQTKSGANSSTAQAATQASVNRVYTTTKKVAKEDFTAASFYDNAVFLGDTVANGISYYNFLSGNKIISDINLTIDKAYGNLDQLAQTSPQKVFLMIGINDLNHGSKSVDSIFDSYSSLVNQIKAKLPNANIYVVSVMPISQSLESKTYIRKANIDALNNKLKTLISVPGVNFLDLAPAFQTESGYINDNVTGNGLSINYDYYGFLLNTIADMLK